MDVEEVNGSEIEVEEGETTVEGEDEGEVELWKSMWVAGIRKERGLRTPGPMPTG